MKKILKSKAYGHIFLISLALLCSMSINAQVIPTTGKNYIVKRTPREATTSIPDLLNMPAPKQGAVIEYYDGLGRPLQTIGIAATPDPKGTGSLDMVTPHVYDGMGREYRQLLPYATSGVGAYQTNAVGSDYASTSEQYKFYTTQPNGVAHDTRPFGETQFDGSPLSRVVGQTGFGSKWQDHPVSTAYGTNTGTEVILWSVDSITGALLNVNNSKYAAGTLYRTQVTDEDNTITVEYKDMEGRVVRKVANYGAATDATHLNATTDYVYDDFGRLRWVLPPKIAKGTGVSSTTDLNALAYYYEYDGYGRMIKKRLPGVEFVYLVYDGRDRLVAVQDGELRKATRWLYTRYDALNRPVETGYVTKASRTIVESAIAAATQFDTPSGTAYTQTSFPVAGDNSSPLTYTFYDNYTNGGATSIDATKTFGQTVATNVTGLPTISRVKELTTNTWSTTTNYYDEKGRMIQSIKKDLYGGKTGDGITVSSQLSFVGQPLQVSEVQTFNGINNMLTRRYDYYDSGQLKGLYVKLNSSTEEPVATYTYNALGQVQQKLYGSGAQKQAYQYNIRGWLTQINDPTTTADYFAMKLGYDTPEVAGTGVVGQYGGNISSMVWRTAQVGNEGSKPKKGYGFSYDGLDRLKGSSYASGDGLTASTAYAESGLGYDTNGNITNLSRTNGASAATTYSYTYKNNGSSNQLDKINGGDQYLYDDNGNATTDGRNGFTIAYNELNLPKSVSKGGQAVNYTYDATGAKLAVTNPDGTARYYHGSMVYNQNKTLAYALHDEGMVLSSGVYQYNLKDHLGNTRAMFSKNAGAGQPVALAQATDYYPFGKSFDNVNVPQNRYLYNGKEMQDQSIGGTTFGWYDYGARFYDPEIGRWHSADPSAENYYNLSTYVYCDNNPIRNADPDGRDKWDKVVGFVAAILDNASPIPTNIRSVYTPSNAADYNRGQDAGDVYSIIAGAGESDTGAGVAGGSVLVTAGTGGLSAEVTVPTFALGTAMAAHGTMMFAKGTNSLVTQKGRVSEGLGDNERKVNPKKEAREAAREKRDQQPASEKRAKDLGKKLEKEKGKDARRNAHDAKDKGAGDRTKKQLLEDYSSTNHK